MDQTVTPYGKMPSELFERFGKIRLLACDVDGVFSDGRIYLGNQGEEIKAFHTLDGYGIKALLKLGIEVAIVTGRRSAIVENRMQALGVKHILQGCEQKQQAVEKLQQTLSINADSTASVGDDMPDIGMFQQSSVKISVPNGHPIVRQQACYVTHSTGGFGAIREICDLILQSHDQLQTIHGASV